MSPFRGNNPREDVEGEREAEYVVERSLHLDAAQQRLLVNVELPGVEADKPSPPQGVRHERQLATLVAGRLDLLEQFGRDRHVAQQRMHGGVLGEEREPPRLGRLGLGIEVPGAAVQLLGQGRLVPEQRAQRLHAHPLADECGLGELEG